MRLGADRKPADPRSLVEAVQFKLQNDILSGKPVPGERLRLHSLIESYSVGMSPLREALARLVGLGLVTQESQRGFAVAPISGEHLDDVTSTRVRLETMAFRLSIENGGTEWEADALGAHHRLARHPRRTKLLIDEEWEELHRTFHLSLIKACGSPTLLSFCETLYNHFDRYRRIAVRTARRHPTMTPMHAKLVDAALQKKTGDAVSLLAAHIQESRKEILRLAGAQMFRADRKAGKTAASPAESARSRRDERPRKN